MRNENMIKPLNPQCVQTSVMRRLNDEYELIRIGFVRYPDWDWNDPQTEHYRLERNGKVFRAYVNHNNPPIYSVLGIVIEEKRGIVDKWRDCCSPGSVERKVINLA